MSRKTMQSTLVTLSENTENYTGVEEAAARAVLQSALSVQDQPQHVQVALVTNGNATEEKLGHELALVSNSLDFDIKVQRIMAKIVGAFSDQDAADISTPFFEAVESMVRCRRIDTECFINITVFCIILVRRYKEASPTMTTRQDKAIWVGQQAWELMQSAYERYNVYAWIEEQGGWTGVLKLVRNKCQTAVDYVPVIQRRGSQLLVLGALTVTITTVAVLITLWRKS